MERNAIQKAVDAAFCDYPRNAALDKIKSEMAEALEDRFEAMRKRGVIEEAALKKVLADFASTLEKTAGFNRKSRLEQVARTLGTSPLGRGQALGRLVASLLALAGLAAVFCVMWIIGGAHRGLAAGAPFLAVAAGTWLYLKLTAYRTDRQPLAGGKALALALVVAIVLGGTLGLLALRAYRSGW